MSATRRLPAFISQSCFFVPSVFWNRLYLKYAAQIAELAFFFQLPLKFENRRVLKKHHGKPGHQTVMELIIKFALLA
jgi:hypothetical protein